MINNNRKFQGVWIPAELWLDRELTLTDKVMLVEIGSLETQDRGCYASNAHFSEFFGLSNSRVSEIINGLVKRGILTVEMIREGKQIVERRLRVSDPFGNPNTPSENAATPFGKRGYPPSENAKGSNTKSNNTNNKTITDVSDAFELFWQSTFRNGSKKKSKEIFASIIKRENHDPMEFAALLVKDTIARKTADQFGFDKLHVTTYLNQERWADEIPKSDSPQAFAEQHYETTGDEHVADFLKGE